MDKEKVQFPDGFLWGAATSAHQVEGGNINNWSEWENNNADKLAKDSTKRFGHLPDWDRIKGQATDPNNYLSGQACDHYNRYESDFDLAQELGHNAHRFSIEWSRLEPEKGNFSQSQFDHYKQVLYALRSRNIEPFVTLEHWTTPLWIAKQDGWINKETPVYFASFVKKVMEELGDLATFWITLNEPLIRTKQFLRLESPGMVKNPSLIRLIIKHMIIAHKEAYKIIHQKPNKKVGISKNCIYFKGWPMANFSGYLWNHHFLKKIRDYQEFIGLNYYHSHNFYSRKVVNHNDLGWEILPEGIYHVLNELKRYNKPIYISENGLADAQDTKRSKFIIDHLLWIHRAIEEGINVKGYLHWSLLDNFEWDKGFWPRFGLIEVDYKTQARTIRPSAKLYAHICKRNCIITDKQL